MRKLYLTIFLLTLLSTVVFAEDKWQENRSTHFIIYYKDAPQDFVKNVEESAESYYGEISHNLGFTRDKSWSWDNRAKIYIYSDAEDYLKSLKELPKWSSGAAFLAEKTIRTFPTDAGFFDSTLPHELGHIIFHEFVGVRADFPSWFDEGVAMYQEKAKRWGANRIVKKAIADKSLIPLKDLNKLVAHTIREEQLANLFYAESASIVYYMITELGEYKFLSLCISLKNGESFDHAIKDVYTRFDNLDDLNRNWIDYLAR